MRFFQYTLLSVIFACNTVPKAAVDYLSVDKYRDNMDFMLLKNVNDEKIYLVRSDESGAFFNQLPSLAKADVFDHLSGSVHLIYGFEDEEWRLGNIYFDLNSTDTVHTSTFSFQSGFTISQLNKIHPNAVLHRELAADQSSKVYFQSIPGVELLFKFSATGEFTELMILHLK